MPLYLIGMPGAGKSTLGQVLSPMLGLTFIDSDAMAEERMGMSINQAVQQHGLAHFRNIESQLLVELVQMPATLVATGGGFPLLPGAMRLMNDTGLTVWLNVPVGELATRILAQPQLRNHLPKATTLQLEESLQALLKEREPYYCRAHVHIAHPQTNDVEGVALRIKEALGVARC